MKVLFVCRGNVGRSQMAEGLFRHLSRKHPACSAGISEKTDRIADVAPAVVSCMKEAGIDISDAARKHVTPQMVRAAGKVIVILEKHEREALPAFVSKSAKVSYWPVHDAKGTSYEFHCRVRDDIRRRVEKLVKEIE